MKTVLTVLLVLAGSLLVRAEEDFCSLTVKVVGPVDDGRKLSEVLVGVQERKGRSAAAFIKDGIVQFCGLGLSSVDVTVGKNHYDCQVQVHEVPLTWNEPRELKITYHGRPCGRLDDRPHAVVGRMVGVVKPISCSALLRFFDESDRWIPGVSLKGPASPAPSSDPYGRLMVSVGLKCIPQLRKEVSFQRRSI